MIPTFSFKSVFEYYAVVPLILLAFAGTYKFGYYYSLDALWILPSLPAQSLFYSILVTSLLFLFGSSLSFLYCSLSFWFGHLQVIIAFLFLCVCGFVGLFFSPLDLKIILIFLSRLLPVLLGFIYYFYVHSSAFGSEIERSTSAPFTVILFLFCFFGMYFSGVDDATRIVREKTLPVVLFDKQPEYPSDITDWRLLEVIDNRMVLINLKDDTNLQIKVVDYSKVDLIQ